MKLSIITTTYNSEKTLRETIKSVLSQTYEDIEYIIVDGNSSDETVSIIKEYENKFEGKLKWISEPDKGIYDAFNKGIEMATGDFIGFLHSDDIFASQSVIEKIVQKQKDSLADIIYGNLQYIHSEKTHRVVRKWKGKPFKLSRLKRGWMPAHPTFFCAKKVYNAVGLYNIQYRISADYDFMLRALRNIDYKVSYLPITITKMKVGGTSNQLGNIRQKMKEGLRIIRPHHVGGILIFFLQKYQKCLNSSRIALSDIQ